jgi:hypothetical protein
VSENILHPLFGWTRGRRGRGGGGGGGGVRLVESRILHFGPQSFFLWNKNWNERKEPI